MEDVVLDYPKRKKNYDKENKKIRASRDATDSKKEPRYCKKFTKNKSSKIGNMHKKLMILNKNIFVT